MSQGSLLNLPVTSWVASVLGLVALPLALGNHLVPPSSPQVVGLDPQGWQLRRALRDLRGHLPQVKASCRGAHPGPMLLSGRPLPLEVTREPSCHGDRAGLLRPLEGAWPGALARTAPAAGKSRARCQAGPCSLRLSALILISALSRPL